MKIVLVASPSSFTEQLKKAFIKNGTEILYVNDREIKILPILKNNIYIWWLIRKLPVLKRINNKLFSRGLINLCRKEKPDLLFVNKGMIVNQGTLKEIKMMGIKTANWFQENAYREVYRNWFLNNYQNYDYLFTNDTRLFEDFFNKSTTEFHYIPTAIDPDYYKLKSLSKEEIIKYFCDVCFVGAFDDRRERILSKVSEIEGINLKIFGWKGWEESSLASLYQGPLDVEQMVKLYNFAKICLNMHVEPITNCANLKTFEIPAAGGFQLSDYRKDIGGLFEKGKEIEIFKNEDELRSKIKFYLNNEDLRKNIALAGQRRVQEHTLEKRVKSMLTYLQVY